MTSDLEWRELGSEPVADGRIFTVERLTAASPVDGATHSFYRLNAPDWAQILPITPAGEAVLVRQYRHGTRSVTLEVPAGLIEPGEDPAAAAARECFEETGYRAPDVVPLLHMYPNPALFSNRLYTFYARGAELAGTIQNTATEQTAVELVPVRDLPRLIERGDIDHALNIAMLWHYLAKFPIA